MDVVSKVTANGLNATVVRQFVPTRIEREVLAQVFAIVYGGAREEWGATRQAEASKDAWGHSICCESVENNRIVLLS